MKRSRLQRLSASVLAVVITAPLSLFAETRTAGRTSLTDLARDLEQALGRGRVEVTGAGTAQHTQPQVSAALSAQAFVDAMNRERAAAGIAPLRLNDNLSLAAGDRVADMLGKQYFDHVSPDGTGPFTWADKRGYRYTTIGENLAIGYPTAASVVNGWMNSPGHRANILQPNFAEIGIAVAAGTPVRRYAGPLVVAMYGAR